MFKKFIAAKAREILANVIAGLLAFKPINYT
jgi:hypothetical protein